LNGDCFSQHMSSGTKKDSNGFRLLQGTIFESTSFTRGQCCRQSRIIDRYTWICLIILSPGNGW
jgi:hypothetical protein